MTVRETVHATSKNPQVHGREIHQRHEDDCRDRTESEMQTQDVHGCTHNSDREENVTTMQQQLTQQFVQKLSLGFEGKLPISQEICRHRDNVADCRSYFGLETEGAREESCAYQEDKAAHDPYKAEANEFCGKCTGSR
jgi:hypothetical protein